MIKHYKLADFVDLLLLHRPAIDRVIQAKSSISHIDLLEIFCLSTESLATQFTYVIGSMKGSQDDQYDSTIARLRRNGKQNVASTLENRRRLPSIDLQENVWLVNRDSDRNRDRDYGYPDYGKFKNRQFISGRANAFTIDWNILSEDNGEVNQAERAFKAWKVLTELAPTGNNITYEDLAKAIGIHHRAIRYVLEPIQKYCIQYHPLQPLTILVVNKQTNEPGAGFIAWSHDNLEEGRAQVRNFDWSKVANPFAFASDGTTLDELVNQILTEPDKSNEVYTKVKVRGMQQMTFRQALLKAYGGRCALSGVGFTEMLDAAHIIPWSQCSPDLKMDPRNGILMLCCYHRLFDIGILSIDEDYRVVFSNKTGLRLTTADHALVSSLHGKEISLPKYKAVWPDKGLIRQRNESDPK